MMDCHTQEELTESRRLYWIDNLRFIGIILVIIGHHGISGRYGEIISGRMIFSFHMPLFFFISGLTKRKTTNIEGYIKKRTSNLIVPYLITAIIMAITNIFIRKWIFVDTLHITDVYYSATEILNTSIIHFTGFGQLWFIPCLFSCEILFIISKDYLLKKDVYTRYVCLLMASIFGVFGIQLAKTFGIINFGQILTALIALPFMYVGYDYMNCDINISKAKKCILIGTFSLFYLYQIRNGVYVNMGTMSYPYYPICIFEALGVIIILAGIIRNTGRIKGVSFWGSNSLILYMVHVVENLTIPWDSIRTMMEDRIHIVIYADILTLLARIVLILAVSVVICLIREKSRLHRKE